MIKSLFIRRFMVTLICTLPSFFHFLKTFLPNSPLLSLSLFSYFIAPFLRCFKLKFDPTSEEGNETLLPSSSNAPGVASWVENSSNLRLFSLLFLPFLPSILSPTLEDQILLLLQKTRSKHCKNQEKVFPEMEE